MLWVFSGFFGLLCLWLSIRIVDYKYDRTPVPITPAWVIAGLFASVLFGMFFAVCGGITLLVCLPVLIAPKRWWTKPL